MSRGIGDARLFDHDPDSGITEFFTYDQHTGGFVIEARQDVSSIIEINKALWNENKKSTRYRDGMHQVAHTPQVVTQELAKQGFITAAGRVLDQKKYAAWLNDPANQCWRTRPGKV